jgi:lipoyl(octanoyl) transferase
MMHHTSNGRRGQGSLPAVVRGSQQSPPRTGRVRLGFVSELSFRTVGFGARAVEYVAAWDLQREVHAGVVAGDPDTVLLLEHPPVFTAGKRTEPHERPLDGSAPVIDVDRGGKITFHGPGQLVGYPIVRLPEHVKVVDYVRRLEEALILACADLGVTTARVPGRSGVWLQAGEGRPERKIAAIGIRVARGVTMHGFAINCDVDLGWYDRFVPCGIDDAGVTSLSQELGREVRVDDAAPTVEKHLRDLLSWAPYTPTPDYEARPDPAKAARAGDLRVPVVNPLR